MHAPALSVPAAAIAAATMCASITAAAASPRRAGKVVRVPRPAKVLSTAVRTCSVFEEATAACNRPVQIGEIGTVIDDEGNHGAATVRAVTVETDGCGTPLGWKVTIELLASATVDAPRKGLLVLDFPLEERARTLSPTSGAPRDGERVLNVVDADGDGDGDLRVSEYACDRTGALERTSKPSFRCTDYALAIRDRWQRARSDRVASCDR